MSDSMAVAVTREEYVGIMSAFPTGVAIVTTLEPDGTPRGLTTNAVTSVSSEPPILLVCVDRDSRTLPALLHSKRFVVNFMRDDCAELCSLFASKADDKFSQVSWTPGLGGVPILHEGAVAHAECADARGARDGGSRGRDGPRRGGCATRPGAGADRLVPLVRERARAPTPCKGSVCGGGRRPRRGEEVSGAPGQGSPSLPRWLPPP